MNLRRVCVCLLMCGLVFSSRQATAQTFYYTNNNPPLTVVPFGGTWTYSVTLYGGNSSSSGTYVTLNSLETGTRNIELGYAFYTPGTFTYTIASVSASDANSYYSLSTSSGTTAGVELRISPAILTQPTNTSCAYGSNTTMGLVAGPESQLYGEQTYYQWFNFATGFALSQASTSPSFPASEAANGETLYCQIYNSYGEVNSEPAVLSIGFAPIISIQPTNVPANFGGIANFSVTVSGQSTAPFYYQWYHDGLPINGANLSYLTIDPVAPTNLGTYAVTITNQFGSITSTTVSLTGSAPTITRQPVNTYTQSGSNATFSVTATGTQPLYYQWFADGIVVDGANLPYISLQSVSATNAYEYSVMVSNALGYVISSPATLNLGFPPSISIQPTNLAVLAGQSANFSVAAGGTPPFSYQWYESTNILTDGNEIEGSESDSLIINPAQTNDIGEYTVTIRNSYGSITSSIANLMVGIPAQSLSICQGNNNIPMITMVGTPGFSYVIEEATNLTPPIVWQPIYTNVAGTNGSCSFADTRGFSAPAVFYQVTAP